ncbi:NAD-binding protein [Artomyces pyxidatus]|uniref:NAD-binding protein n=1 Tax=Artomyces pyxidatus TaxID=48021 RepID=A0ACB8THR4_9AGAM|nr:NAD-binding protein [Artomyces pyxidatus]
MAEMSKPINDLPPAVPVSFLSEVLLPPKPTWTSEDVPDLTGKIAIVTGGNTGIGKETCRVLLAHNAKVYLAARSESKGSRAIEELQEKTGKTAVFLRLDLADLRSIRQAAEAFVSQEQQLHILFNNGGVMFPPLDLVTAQGYDGQFGTNTLGHFFFTKLLLPILLQTAKGEPNAMPCKVRVVNTSSVGHNLFVLPGGINWESIQPGNVSLKARTKIGTHALYGQSKLGNILFSNELAKRYGDQGIVSISLHPGSIKTELGRHISGSLFRNIIRKLANLTQYDVTYGAISQLYAGTSLQAEKLNGEASIHLLFLA